MLSDPRFIAQLLMAGASLLAVVRYARYLREGQAARQRGEVSQEMPKHLQLLLGIPLVYFWYIMPFLPQPLLGNWALSAPDLLPHSPARWAQWALGLLLGAGGSILYIRLTKANLAVTAQDYCRPAVLLTNGPYARLRHPIVAARLVAVAGVTLFSGGAYTAILLPVLAGTLMVTARIEEREILLPVFGLEYALYSRKTPAFLCRPLFLALLALAAGFALSAM